MAPTSLGIYAKQTRAYAWNRTKANFPVYFLMTLIAQVALTLGPAINDLFRIPYPFSQLLDLIIRIGLYPVTLSVTQFFIMAYYGESGNPRDVLSIYKDERRLGVALVLGAVWHGSIVLFSVAAEAMQAAGRGTLFLAPLILLSLLLPIAQLVISFFLTLIPYTFWRSESEGMSAVDIIKHSAAKMKSMAGSYIHYFYVIGWPAYLVMLAAVIVLMVITRMTRSGPTLNRYALAVSLALIQPYLQICTAGFADMLLGRPSKKR